MDTLKDKNLIPLKLLNIKTSTNKNLEMHEHWRTQDRRAVCAPVRDLIDVIRYSRAVVEQKERKLDA